jgi:hypothetical protein
MTNHCILWHRLDQPGHECARLVYKEPNWHLVGTAVFAHNRQPCRLDYLVVCNSAWETRSGRVSGWVGDQPVEIELSVDSSRHWFLNRIECPEVAGCIDLDLNFSPSTNLLPIRRLDPAVGQAASVKAAWLRFPSFSLEPLEQVYRRLDATSYRYESAGGRFVTELQVNAAGFVIEYPHLWAIEAVL